jgi:GNAT superfamily N-acetyltransferase
MTYITLTPETLDDEHICCAFSDKKCVSGYLAKKAWLKDEYDRGYRFQRLDERAKVFIEYGPAEEAWVPIDAPNYLHLGCFWVSGKYKKNGHGKALLQKAIEAAKEQGCSGLVTVVGTKKNHFMSDGKWLIRQGFEVCDQTEAGFDLIYLPLAPEAEKPRFRDSARKAKPASQKGCVAYYSNRCPFTEFHVGQNLKEACANRGIPLKVIKLETKAQAQDAPSPATIFSLFLDGKLITTDLSACMDSRFDKVVGKHV